MFAVEHRVFRNGQDICILDIRRLRLFKCDSRIAEMLPEFDGRNLGSVAESLGQKQSRLSQLVDELNSLGLLGSSSPFDGPPVETDPWRVPIPSLAMQLDNERTGRCIPLVRARLALRTWMNHPAPCTVLALTLFVDDLPRHVAEVGEILKIAERMAHQRGASLQPLVRANAKRQLVDIRRVNGAGVLLLYDLDELLSDLFFEADIARCTEQIRPWRGRTMGMLTLRPRFREKTGELLSKLKQAGMRGFHIQVLGKDGHNTLENWVLDAMGQLQGEMETNSLIMSPILFPLYRLANAQPVLYGCQAGGRHLAVSTEGFFYPCQCFFNEPRSRMGNVEQGVDQERRRAYLRAHVDERPVCQVCWARYICGGGCLRAATNDGRTIGNPLQANCEAVFKLVQKVIHGFRDSYRVISEMNYDALAPFVPHIIGPRSTAVNGHRYWLLAQGSSMAPTINDGDLVQIESVDAEEIVPGDIVAFQRHEGTIIHRIIERVIEENGIALIEKGDNSNHVSTISPSSVLGRVVAIQRR